MNVKRRTSCLTRQSGLWMSIFLHLFACAEDAASVAESDELAADSWKGKIYKTEGKKDDRNSEFVCGLGGVMKLPKSNSFGDTSCFFCEENYDLRRGLIGFYCYKKCPSGYTTYLETCTNWKKLKTIRRDRMPAKKLEKYWNCGQVNRLSNSNKKSTCNAMTNCVWRKDQCVWDSPKFGYPDCARASERSFRFGGFSKYKMEIDIYECRPTEKPVD